MYSKFILRFDDITPSMAWSKFSAFDELANELNIPLLVGVVPHCLDPSLAIELVRTDFWDVVRGWVDRGWTVAQHGYTHQYVTKNAGIMDITPQSELAGLSYEDQYAKLKAGKDILVEQRVWQPVFMAPSHSFDHTTLQVLSDLDFRYITDGKGVFPYKMGKLILVPQLFSKPKNHFGFGVYTLCLHVNTMKQSDKENILQFMRAHHKKIISFDNAVTVRNSLPGVAIICRFLTARTLLRIIILLKQKLQNALV